MPQSRGTFLFPHPLNNFVKNYFAYSPINKEYNN